MALCGPCQAIVDDNPIAMLIRRDVCGNNLLCAQCRTRVYQANDSVKSGHAFFEFANPNRADAGSEVAEVSWDQAPPGQNSVGASSEKHAASVCSVAWSCPRCHSAIFATPRLFEGDNEPRDWWWCKTCQRMQREADAAERDAERKRRHAATTASEAERSKGKRKRMADEAYPKLDKWLATAL